MSESEYLSTLIANIYDAALDQTLWSRVLPQICAFVQASAGNLYAQDSTSKQATLYHAHGEDEHYVQLYFDKYIGMNPLYPALTFFDVGEVHSQSDIISYDEFHQTRFYQEWVRPQGIVDVLFANLEKSATGSAVLALRRYEPDGLVDDEARRRMSLVVPHVRRAVTISKMFDFQQAKVSTLTDVLGGLSAGVFLVDANARIMFANPAAQAMMDEQKVVSATAGALVAVDREADRALRASLAAVGGGDETPAAAGAGVPMLDRDGQRWLAQVLPLASGSRAPAQAAHFAVAAIFIRKALLDTVSPIETLARLYRLTGSEVRVLQAVVEMSGVATVADALGISEPTVRTHLQRIFAKTDTKRQADLVKLVASYTSPLAQ